jgi:hypothetical protein
VWEEAKMKRILFLCTIFALITGCISFPWVKADGPYTAPAQNVSVEIPDGWMRKNTDDYLLVTKDGPLLQYVMVERIHLDQDLKHTKKKFRKGMLPQELARIIIDNNSSNQSILNLKVRSNKPAKIKGHRGFKLLLTYKDKDGLKYKSLYYGFMKGEWFYGIRYNAPQRYYYKKELNAFKKIMGSLKLTS